MRNGVHYLAQAYFHQDFQEMAEEPIKVVEVFCRREPPEVVAALRTGVAELIQSDPTDEDLSRVWLDDGGAYYDPATDGISMREWLQSIADVLDEKSEVNASGPETAEPNEAMSPVPASGGATSASTDVGAPAVETADQPADPSPGIPFKGIPGA